jgi:hypothetical protein
VKFRAILVLVTLFLTVKVTFPQQAAPSPYEVDEAYLVYGALLPFEEGYINAQKSLVIQRETVPTTVPAGSDTLDLSCLNKSLAGRFNDAIADFDRVNTRRWLLQAKVRSLKAYKLVSADAIQAFFKDQDLKHSWDAFYKRYPGSGGFLTVTAVGFNRDKTLAVVHSGTTCGSLCGSWALHFLQKVDGEWKETATACHMMSMSRSEPMGGWPK